ncbi:MAG TPA: phosphoglycerate mutase [Ramlibacter sp.]|nr:phosphoglycerate mutase [Ramlibacter sp.]
MSDGAHLLIPFAFATAEGCTQALRTLALPQLEKLLARLAPLHTDAGDEFGLSMPHERVLARECGLPCEDGRIPWAAWQVVQAGREAGGHAWARITPCHWTVATNHIDMNHPQDLHLDAGQSRSLLAAMRPFFEQDGIALEYESPTLWLAQGELFRGLATASLDRVIGRAVDDWMPRAPEARALRRLQQEMQMLLYTNEVNDERVRGGALPVNSFWTSGTGALAAEHAAEVPWGLEVTPHLRDAALLGDWRGWAAAWQQLDAKECAGLIKAADAGQPVTLTLCGERNARTWSSQPAGALRRRLGGLFGGKQAASVLESL